MTYMTQTDMSNDYYLTNRVAACAAGEGQEFPDQWAHETRRTWAAAPGWDEAWDSYLVSNPPPPGWPDAPAEVDPPVDPWIPPGKNEAVISDGMILSQVQGMLGA